MGVGLCTVILQENSTCDLSQAVDFENSNKIFQTIHGDTELTIRTPQTYNLGVIFLNEGQSKAKVKSTRKALVETTMSCKEYSATGLFFVQFLIIISFCYAAHRCGVWSSCVRARKHSTCSNQIRAGFAFFRPDIFHTHRHLPH